MKTALKTIIFAPLLLLACVLLTLITIAEWLKWEG